MGLPYNSDSSGDDFGRKTAAFLQWLESTTHPETWKVIANGCYCQFDNSTASPGRFFKGAHVWMMGCIDDTCTSEHGLLASQTFRTISHRSSYVKVHRRLRTEWWEIWFVHTVVRHVQIYYLKGLQNKYFWTYFPPSSTAVYVMYRHLFSFSFFFWEWTVLGTSRTGYLQILKVIYRLRRQNVLWVYWHITVYIMERDARGWLQWHKY